jgi:sugar phosphate isomerase/epimerase
MNTFMIGQYGSFDFTKFRRDFGNNFYGIEACLFEQEQDTLNLIHESRRGGFQVGIHFPLRAGASQLRDALFLSRDEVTRQQAFASIEEELEYATAVHPDYILFHYPKPVILDDHVDWALWHFEDRREFVYESEFSYEEFQEKSEYLFEWLAAKGRAYAFIPVPEFDALNPYIYETDFLESLLQRYPNIRLCLDTSRLYLQECIDPNFNSRAIIRRYAPYAHLLHLSNIKVTDRIEQKKFPVLPDLSPDDGWAPIEDYLLIIKEKNPNIKIMFEHHSQLISDEQLEACYQWVAQILTTESSLKC